jgi:hypothetical protein
MTLKARFLPGLVLRQDDQRCRPLHSKKDLKALVGSGDKIGLFVLPFLLAGSQ